VPWIKAFHIVFMVSWFAGLFYLPRLFVYHCGIGDDTRGHTRFCVMERRLYAISLIGMLGTWIFGIWLLLLEPGYLHAGWLHAKLALVLLLSGYQGWLKANLRRFAQNRNRYGERFWRIANEVPALLLIAIVILVVVKPF
jgi:putative membrane protein